MFIYVIVCNESLKLYVGQHSCKDLQKYLRKKFYDAARRREVMPHLYRAMQKYPQETWSIWPLVSGIETRAELDELEKYYIRVLKAQHSDVGYNIGKGGGCASFESRKGYPTAGSFKPGHKRRVGLKHSEESIRKMSESHRGAPGTWIGRKHSEESKQKMRISQAARYAKIIKPVVVRKVKVPKPPVIYVRSEETRRRLSESHKGKIPSNIRAVVCVDTEERFPSIADAARANKTFAPNIRRAIATNTKAGGQRWAYAEQA